MSTHEPEEPQGPPSEPPPRGSAQNPYAPPAAAPEPLPEVPLLKPNKASAGQRVAGALMLLNAIFIFAEAMVMKEAPKQVGGLKFGIGPAIIDVIIGAVLLSGARSLVTWAIVRCSLGLVAGAALAAMNGPFAMAMQITLSGSLLALLIGEAGRARILVASCGFALYGVVELIGLSAVATGKNPLGSLVASMRGDIEGSPVSKVTGKTVGFQIDLPAGRWYHRTPDKTKPMSPTVEVWLVRPDTVAEVLVMAEHAPGKTLSVDAYTDAVMKSLAPSPGFHISERRPWRIYPDDGRIVRLRMMLDGNEYEYIYGIVTVFERAFQVVTCVPKAQLAEMETELFAILDSFQLPKGALESMPEDIDPAPAGAVNGVSVHYTIKAPGTRWHLRKQEAVAKENPAIERWLTRPDKDAHVMIVAEELEAGTIDIERFAGAVLENMKGMSGGFTLASRTAWRNDPTHGLVLSGQSDLNGTPLRRKVLVWANGRRAVQVIAVMREADKDLVEPEVTSMFDAFEPPKQK